MAKVSIKNIKIELVVFLRNSDIITTTVRGVTTRSDTGTFAGDSTHTLATNPTRVKNVRSVVVASVTLAFGTDYTVNYDTGVITFTASQTGAYTISYDEGTTDRIFPDFPQPHLTQSSFPRLAVDVITGKTVEGGIGGGSNFTEYVITVVAYDKDHDDVETMIAAIRSAFQSHKQDFFYIPFITPTDMGPMLVSPFGENKILQRNQDFKGQFVLET